MRNVSWARLRELGFRRCSFSLKHNQSANSCTHKFARRGDQCRNHISPGEMARRDGLPVCAVHWPMFLEAVREDAARRAALRAKYDPGPLPLEDDGEEILPLIEEDGAA